MVLMFSTQALEWRLGFAFVVAMGATNFQIVLRHLRPREAGG
jgi:hypothetical protein